MSGFIPIDFRLKRSLFGGIRDKDHRRYNALREYIFPDRSQFINFLNTDDHERKYKISRDLISLLCFRSNFPPPEHLFYNLFFLESSSRSKVKNGFVGRDHYIHIVYTYLLGIYIFFCQGDFFEQNLSYFDKIRRSFSRKENISNKDTDRRTNSGWDFISCWRSFALCHDLGYPWEILSDHLDAKGHFIGDGLERKYLYCYRGLDNRVLKDVAMKCLARMLGVGQACRTNSDETFDLLFFYGNKDFYRSESNDTVSLIELDKTIQKSIMDKIGAALLLDRIQGPASAKALTSFISWENLVGVLFEDGLDRPIAAVIPGEKYKTYRVIYCQKHHQTPAALFREAFIDCCSSSKNRFWKYFSVQPSDQWRKSIEIALGEEYVSKFNDLLAFANESIFPGIAMLSDDDAFRLYCFEIYKLFFSELGGLRHSDHVDADDVYNEAIVVRSKDIVDGLSESISDEIYSKIKDEIRGNYQDLAVGIISKQRKMVANLRKMIAKVLKTTTVRQNVIKEAIESYESSLITIITIHECWDALRGKLSTVAQTDEHIFKKNTDLEFTVNKDNIQKLCRAHNVEKRLEGLGSYNLESLIDNFIPGALLGKEGIIDHGIMGAFTYIEINHAHRKLAADIHSAWRKRERFSGIQYLINMALEAQGFPRGGNLRFESERLSEEVMIAILIHNLKGIPNETASRPLVLEDNPFAYLAILVDELQEWCRPQTASPIAGTNRHYTASSDFDIHIEDNKIHISERNLNRPLGRRESDIVKSIDQKIYQGSKYIKFLLSQG